jgi:SRSO17 transposase
LGHTLVDRELYLPKEWATDEVRRAEAHIPPSVTFQTKPALARHMLERARAGGMRFNWVTGDSIYGSDLRLRLWLEEQPQPFVLAINCNEALWCGIQQQRADVLAQVYGFSGLTLETAYRHRGLSAGRSGLRGNSKAMGKVMGRS